jgi:galactokinase
MTTPTKPAYVNMQGAITKVVAAHDTLTQEISNAARREREARQARHRALEQQRALDATKALPNA